MPRPYRGPPRRPPLSSAEYQQRKQALRQYRCPFRDEPNGCKRESNSDLCSFAHPDPGRPDGDGQLLDLPSYVCVFNLLNCCKKRTVQMARGPHTTDTIAVCNSSCFHLTTSELMNIEAFEIDHCALIASFFSADGTRECSICMERVYSKRIGFSRSFGILENCKHVYCAPCIIAWQAANSNKLVICPMCRVVSTKVAIRSQFTEDAVEKKAIFDRLKNVRSFV